MESGRIAMGEAERLLCDEGRRAASDRRRRNSWLHVLPALARFGPRLPAWSQPGAAPWPLSSYVVSRQCCHTRVATVQSAACCFFRRLRMR